MTTRRRRLTLRTRLTLILSGILVVAVAASGVAGALLLRASLVSRLDQQLAAAGGRFSASLENGGTGGPVDPGGSDDDADNAVPGQSVGTFGARLVHGVVTEAAVVDDDGRNTVPRLDASDAATLAAVPVGGRPRTVELSGLGDYRVQAVAGRDGDVQVTGLPESGVDDTVSRLVTIEAVVLVVVVLAAGGATLWSVRRSLRPLETVVATATHVAELPLTEPGVEIPVEPTADEPTTEVQQVAFAFDRMLGHVRSALAARDETEGRLRRFVADASHELRTPLATISAYAEFAHRGGEPLPEATEQALDRIEAASARMSVLVEELLVLARLDESRPLAREPVDVVQTVAEIVIDTRTAHPDHRWVLELPDDAVTVEGDPVALHRALENLVRNAAVHTPAGTTVRTTVAASRDRVEIAVADDGPGIPHDQLAAVFDRFTRVDAARSSDVGGTGLGLAITRGVVRAHRGSVRLDSVPGDTRFVVDLPLAAAGDPA